MQKTSSTDPGARASGWGLPFGLLLAGLVWLGLWTWELGEFGVPGAQSKSAPNLEFSAHRAADLMRGWLPRSEPHPMGSPAHARVRSAIVSSLDAMGAEVEIQEAWAHEHDEKRNQLRLGRVHNVIATWPGAGAGPGSGERSGEGPPGKELLLMAHYDSVAAGPGEHDDLVNCAVWLEALRAFAAGRSGPPKFRMRLLLTDGEEAGLFGARAYAGAHENSGDVGLVLNLEARGAGGPSRMFETGLGNQPWVDLYAEGARAPSANSVAVEVYRRMPNGSDLTVFLDRNVPGLNFAYIGDWAAYHSRLDRLDRGDLDSVQHQGENVLGVLRSLQKDPALLHDGPPVNAGDRVYVDILSRFLLRYSPGVQWCIAFGALLLALAAIGKFCAGRTRNRAGKRIVPRPGFGLITGVMAWLLWVSIALPIAGLGLQGLEVLAGNGPVFWSRHLPAGVFGLGCYLVGLAMLLPLLRPWDRANPGSLFLGSLVPLVVLALALALKVPGAGYLFGPWALMVAAAGFFLPRRWWPACALGATILGLFVWVPLHHALLLAFGWSSAVALVLPLALMTGSLPAVVVHLPRGAGGWLASLGILGIGFSGAIALLRDPFTPQDPATLNVQFTQSEVMGDDALRFRTKPFQSPPRIVTASEAEGGPPEASELVSEVGYPTLLFSGADPNGWYLGDLRSARGATSFRWVAGAPESEAETASNDSGSPEPLRGTFRLDGLEIPVDARSVVWFGVPEEGLSFGWKPAEAGPHPVPEAGASPGPATPDATDSNAAVPPVSGPSVFEGVLYDETSELPKSLADWTARIPAEWVPRGRGHVWRLGRETTWPKAGSSADAK